MYRNKYKYQLIHPIVGTRAYQTNSFKKGAKKCYEELKSLDNINTTQFTVLNLDTFQTYKFQIDTHKINKQQHDQELEYKNEQNKSEINKIESIQNTLNNLDSRITKLENLIHQKNDTNIDKDAIIAQAVDKNLIYNQDYQNYQKSGNCIIY